MIQFQRVWELLPKYFFVLLTKVMTFIWKISTNFIVRLSSILFIQFVLDVLCLAINGHMPFLTQRVLIWPIIPSLFAKFVFWIRTLTYHTPPLTNSNKKKSVFTFQNQNLLIIYQLLSKTCNVILSVPRSWRQVCAIRTLRKRWNTLTQVANCTDLPSWPWSR